MTFVHIFLCSVLKALKSRHCVTYRRLWIAVFDVFVSFVDLRKTCFSLPLLHLLGLLLFYWYFYCICHIFSFYAAVFTFRLMWIKRFMCQSQWFGCHLLLYRTCTLDPFIYCVLVFIIIIQSLYSIFWTYFLFFISI